METVNKMLAGIVKFIGNSKACIRVVLRQILIVCAVVGGLTFITVNSPLQAENKIFKEYQIKAVFIYNFVNFVTWPEDTGSDKEAPFIIGIAGDDAVQGFLEKVVADETVKGRKIVVRYIDAFTLPLDCRILFISKTIRKDALQILKAAAGRKILTVGDFKGFIQAGGIINFSHAQGRIQIEINKTGADLAGLAISSKLLKLAQIVEPDSIREGME